MVITRVAPDIRPTGYPAFFNIRYPTGYPVSFAGYPVSFAGYPVGRIAGYPVGRIAEYPARKTLHGIFFLQNHRYYDKISKTVKVNEKMSTGCFL